MGGELPLRAGMGLRLAACALRGSYRSGGKTNVRAGNRQVVIGNRVSVLGEPPTLVGGATASRGRQSPEKIGKQAPVLRLLRELTLAARWMRTTANTRNRRAADFSRRRAARPPAIGCFRTDAE